MAINLKNLRLGERKNFIFILIFSGILISAALFLAVTIQKPKAIFSSYINPVSEPQKELTAIQENALLAISSPSEPQIIQKIKVVITGYSSTPWETDDTPFITAAGTGVKEGIVANNLLAFGTKIRIPELYGDKVFIVEDRMNQKKGKYHFDIWFPSYWEAKNFGAKTTYIEILES